MSALAGLQHTKAAQTGKLTLPDGRQLAWRQVGAAQGVPVFHCHGGLSCAAEIDFADAQCRALGVRWLAADRPGIGDSDPQPARRLSDWAADLRALLAHLGIARIAVTGWSAGGPYALACAAALPEVWAVATLAGMAPLRGRADIAALGMATDRLLFSLSPRSPKLAAVALAPSAHVPEALLRQAIKRMLTDSVDGASLDTETSRAVARCYRHSLRQGSRWTVQDYRLLASDWGFSLPDIRVPVDVWHGEQDTLLVAEHGQRLAAGLTNATLHRLDGYGHFLPQRHLGAVLRTLCHRFQDSAPT